ncbi:MAG TPA: hypothetical protein VFF94_03820, partial [Novosphingobium sp.]|nr:hypothetical protein [Novosphingobium sp.]
MEALPTQADIGAADVNPADTPAGSFAGSRPQPLRPIYRALYNGGERNAVLNFERLGLAALQMGDYSRAEWAFDQALNRIEAIYANNPQAATARSVFHNEANKDFKGEPYERAMAYYYRGLLYLRVGDFSNARASFKMAEYQDTLSDSESFESEFAVMDYLVGWTLRCDGQGATADESFAIAAKAQAGLAAPPPTDNVLFIAEIGNGPQKLRDGAQAQKLLFRAGPAYPETTVAVSLAAPARKAAPGRPVAKPAAASAHPIPLMEAGSVSYQATTRGGRAIDGLMNGKANWKSGTDTVGNVALIAGASGMFGNDAGGSLGMMGFGLAMKMFSSGMKTNADIRAWDGLPDKILVATAHAPAPDWTYAASYRAGEVALPFRDAQMRADPKGCSVVWLRARPAAYGEAIVGEDAGVAASVAKKKQVQEKNTRFRAQLEE